MFDKSNPNKIKKNKINSDNNEVNIILTIRYGLFGALLAYPDSVFSGTFKLIGRKIKNRIHHKRINIKTCVKISIKF